MEFIIWIDQRSLLHLDDQRLTTPWQHKAMTKLLGLQYRLQYKKGVENRAADALLRKCSLQDGELTALSTCIPTWLIELTEEYKKDNQTSRVIAELSMRKSQHPKFSFKDGILRYDGRIWIGSNITLQQRIMHSMHSSAIGGHSGFQVTYNKKKSCLPSQG